MKKTRWIIPLVLLALFVAFFFGYTGVYCRADETAQEALKASAGVKVEQTEYGWFFDGPEEDTALIFYPGGKVEETAYAPLLHSLAENGADVCLVKMPFRLAFFSVNAAEEIMNRYGYKNWYIGGHSLGGVAAALYAEKHDLDGLVLLASYPTKEVDEPMLLVYGSEDGVLNLERVAQAEQYGSVEKTVIEGGNHAGFGNYGEQKSDGKAGISAEEQQAETTDIVIRWLGLHSVPDLPAE